MPSRYLMQVVDRKSGEVVQFEPGRAVETAFVEDCVERIISLGVGFGRTEKHVEADVRAGIQSAILALKVQIRPS